MKSHTRDHKVNLGLPYSVIAALSEWDKAMEFSLPQCAKSIPIRPIPQLISGYWLSQSL